MMNGFWFKVDSYINGFWKIRSKLNPACRYSLYCCPRTSKPDCATISMIRSYSSGVTPDLVVRGLGFRVALIIRIGLGGPLYYNYNQEPPK